MRGLAVLVAVVAAALPVALDTGEAAPRPLTPAPVGSPALERLLALRFSGDAASLVWLDPRTLAPVDRQTVDVGLYTGPVAYSPDRSTLVLGRGRDVAGVRFVDLASRRRAGGLGLQRGWVEAVAWVAPRRLLALAASPIGGAQTLYVVDPVARRRLRAVPVPGRLEEARRAGTQLVLLLSPPDQIGVATLAVVGSEGDIRTVRLDRISVGTIVPEEGSDPIGTTRRAGLAVDPEAGRAYVVGADEPVAEVDLAALAVSYHSPGTHPSLLRRLLRWLHPAAEAKGINGPLRDAWWLGDGMLAVAGGQESTTVDAEGKRHFTRAPAGLELIDTRTWSARMIEPQAASCQLVAGLLVATTGSLDTGDLRLLAFDRTGALRFSAADAAAAGWLVGAGRYLYRLDDGEVSVLDPATGAVVASVLLANVVLIPGDSIDG